MRKTVMNHCLSLRGLVLKLYTPVAYVSGSSKPFYPTVMAGTWLTITGNKLRFSMFC